METNIDIYDRKKTNKNILNRLKNADICQRNKELILNFVEHKKLYDNIGIGRQTKYMVKLRILAEHLKKPFDKATKKDIEELLKTIYEKKVKRGGVMAELTTSGRADYALMLKLFMVFVKGEEHPEESDWIKPPRVKKKRLSASEIITWDDVVMLSTHAMNARDKAFVQVLWDSGCRIEELCTLLIKDIEFSNKGEALYLNIRKSKTEERAPVIIWSAPALIYWLENHPLRSDKNAPLWCQLKKPFKPLNYAAARKILIDLKKRSEFDKPINPHQFRKSSATYYAGFMGDQDTKVRFGWVSDSSQLATYIHRQEDDANNKVLEREGLLAIHEKKDTNKFKPIICPFCKQKNPAGAEICVLCRRPLDVKKQYGVTMEDIILKEKLEATLKDLMTSPEFLSMITDSMKKQEQPQCATVESA